MNTNVQRLTDEVYQRPLPLIPLRRSVVFPHGTASIPLGRQRSKAVAFAVKSGDWIALAFQRDPEKEDPALVDFHPIGILARTKNIVDRGSKGTLLVVDTIERLRLRSLTQLSPYITVLTEAVEQTSDNDQDESVIALAESLRSHLSELVPDDRDLRSALESAQGPDQLADRIASWIDAEHDRKIAALHTIDVKERLAMVTQMLREAKTRAELRQQIDSEVRRGLSKEQRKVLLRQQLRAIQQELGEGEEGDAHGLREKLDKAELPEEVRTLADREFERMNAIGSSHPETHVIRTYLEWLADLPWSKRAPTKQDIDDIERILERDHHGLEEPKRRILEHMAVLKLAGKTRGTILCFVGPPGVGKTSLAQSIADATGRPLARVALGGVRDEAEIRGHRRTYIGALPGRVITALKRAQVRNPVIVLDEIDKLGRGMWGDSEAALLEVLDPEQNKHFVDHYLEAPFDLSEVLFIATANELSPLSPPLRDRLEIIEISGYTTEEKAKIAATHLLPKQLEEHGIPHEALTLSDDLLRLIVNDYTREAGVRQLSQQLAKLCRSIGLKLARQTDVQAPEVVALSEAEVRKVLGKPRYFYETAERMQMPGVAAGLAWTPVGGDVLYVESTRMPGKGGLEITGQLGEVMTESAKAALAYLRSHAETLGIQRELIEKHDVHIHVPAGAVPKDGPSAGITMFTALASLFTERRVRSDTAMTGEVTLRGRVLPVGGIKSKVLAAHRAGFERIILPKRNMQDLEEVPSSVREKLQVIFVEDVNEVIREALEPEPTSPSYPTSPLASDSNVHKSA